MLKFLGRNSAFDEEHNSAFFYYGKDLILIDCSVPTFQKIRKADLHDVENIKIIVTHTHSDHVSGIALLIDYEFFVGKIPVTVIAPSREVMEDLRFFIERLDGCGSDWYSITNAEDSSFPWLKEVVLTEHTEQLRGRTFGYVLEIDGKRVVYTGDTNTTEPFEPYLTEGTYFFMEVSAYKSQVHLNIDNNIELITNLTKKGVRVYLMHMDDENYISRAAEGTGALPAPLAEKELSDPSSVLNNIFDISDRLYTEMCYANGSDHSTLFKYLTDLGKTLLPSDRASFWKWDKRAHTIWTTSATGVDKIEIPDDTGLVGKALKTGKVVVTNDPYSDPDFNSEVDKKTGYVTRSVLVLPVANINGEFIGAFQLINKFGNKGFDEVEDVRKLSLAALICGIALESETFLEDSHHDKLTGLKNRMGFYSDFSRRFRKYLTAQTDKPLSLFICDIDKFKRVNDTYGHNAGDDVLSFTASLIRKACTEKDCCYRWGGEEFIMLMEDTAIEQAVEKAEAVRKTVMDSEIDADGNLIHCTLSFGVVPFDASKTIEENISIADGYLYTAKETGRNRVIYSGNLPQ